MTTRPLRYMDQSEIDKARGNPCTFSVVRDGRRVERSGKLGRVTLHTVWVGAFCYSRDEVADMMVEVDD